MSGKAVQEQLARAAIRVFTSRAHGKRTQDCCVTIKGAWQRTLDPWAPNDHMPLWLSRERVGLRFWKEADV